MNLNAAMNELLQEIRRIEPEKNIELLDVSDGQLGNRLIELYARTRNLRTRELITQFMQHAGAIWLHKLFTRDSSPVQTPTGVLASIEDYVRLIAANDDEDLDQRIL